MSGEAEGSGQDPQGGAGRTGEATGQDGAGDDDARRAAKLDHEETAKALKAVRGEAASHRIELKKTKGELEKLKTGLLKALGQEEDSDAGVKELTAKVDALMHKLSTSDRKEAFRLVAKSLGADSDLTWAYLTSTGKLDDPEADVSKLVKAALKDKPALKAHEAVATGDEGAGGAGTKTKNMNAFIRRAAGR